MINVENPDTLGTPITGPFEKQLSEIIPAAEVHRFNAVRERPSRRSRPYTLSITQIPRRAGEVVFRNDTAHDR